MMYALALALTGALAIQAAPDPQAQDPAALVAQARRLATAGNHDEALSMYRRVIAAQPTNYEAHLGAGLVLDLKLQLEEARTHLARALELAPEDSKVQPLNALAVSWAFEGNAREAASFYQKVFDRHMAAENFGAAAGTANALGRVYLETGDVENARRWYETGYEMARRQPDTPGAQLRLWEFRWRHAQGRIAARAGRLDEARRHVADARALVEGSPELKDEFPTWHYLDGYVALQAKQYEHAIQALQMADGRDAFVLMLLAQAYEGAGNAPRARETWQQILQSNGHNLQTAFALPVARGRLADR